MIVGAEPVLQGTFRDADGALVNPTTVILEVEGPDLVEQSWTGMDLTNPSTGVFRRAVLLDQEGVWRWRWTGETTEGTAVTEGTICVAHSVFAGVS